MDGSPVDHVDKFEVELRMIAKRAPWWLPFIAIPYAIYDWLRFKWFEAKVWAVLVMEWE